MSVIVWAVAVALVATTAFILVRGTWVALTDPWRSRRRAPHRSHWKFF